MPEGSQISRRRHLWLLVPALAWAGILAGVVPPFPAPWLDWGSIGCVLASLAIAVLALLKPKKDIVSLCTPFFALFIFISPLERYPDFLIQVLYAATLTGLVIRLERRFS